ncbi:MAG: ribosome biogenesis GTP-binding protein YsxC [Deltaproteobacteria bacterium]|nr:ribosome biogenesis GTP-binding protein YsxC [Deltaproteobacteria bacterium]
MKRNKSSSRFVASANSYKYLPECGDIEIAFAGRSNVGKSSLLGAVLGQSKIVRTSRTPGRTQSLNLFLLEEQIALVDLPGYGYAKLPKTHRQAIEEMLRSYLKARIQLVGVVLLVDARREQVSDLDQAFAKWVLQNQRKLLLVITKSDLIPKTRRSHVINKIESDLNFSKGTALLCSAHTGDGISELKKTLWQLVNESTINITR